MPSPYQALSDTRQLNGTYRNGEEPSLWYCLLMANHKAGRGIHMKPQPTDTVRIQVVRDGSLTIGLVRDGKVIAQYESSFSVHKDCLNRSETTISEGFPLWWFLTTERLEVGLSRENLMLVRNTNGISLFATFLPLGGADSGPAQPRSFNRVGG